MYACDVRRYIKNIFFSIFFVRRKIEFVILGRERNCNEIYETSTKLLLHSFHHWINIVQLKNGKLNFHYWISLHFTIVKTLKTEWSGSKKRANFLPKKVGWYFGFFLNTHTFLIKKGKIDKRHFPEFHKRELQNFMKKRKFISEDFFSLPSAIDNNWGKERNPANIKVSNGPALVQFLA